MKPQELNHHDGSWRSTVGPHGDVVLSSRVRLARNLDDVCFPHRADTATRQRVLDSVFEAAHAVDEFADGGFWPLPSLSELERLYLVERHQASARLVRDPSARGVIVARDELVGLQVNEEDHLRIQTLRPGLDTLRALRSAQKIDHALEKHLDFAYTEERGYLTACPTNVGTGLRASVLIHLPALGMTGEVAKIHRAVHEMGMALRGTFGEGSGALGEFFQLSNQRTLGRAEEQSVDEFERVVKRVVELEGEARACFAESEVRRRKVEDRVQRSFGLLCHARLLTVEEAIAHTSDLRLGLGMKLLAAPSVDLLNRLDLAIQPAHLAMHCGRVLTNAEEQWERATYLRAAFAAPPTADDPKVPEA